MPLLVTSAQHPSHIQVVEEKAHGRISMATYYRYFRAGGNFLILAIVLVVFLMGEVGVCVHVCAGVRAGICTACMCVNVVRVMLLSCKHSSPIGQYSCG